MKMPAPADGDEPGTVDTAVFTKAGQAMTGHSRSDRFQRLDESLASDEGQVDWHFEGYESRLADGSKQHWLRLRAGLKADLYCARCDQPVTVMLEVDRRYQLVATEKQAAELDSQADDFDVLVASRQFSLTELLEDECLMALPAFASHETCEPVQAVLQAASGVNTASGAHAPADAAEAGAAIEDGTGPEAGSERPNPFAVLARLKRGSES